MAWLHRQDWIPDLIKDGGIGMEASADTLTDRLFSETIARCFHTAENGLSFDEEWQKTAERVQS